MRRARMDQWPPAPPRSCAAFGPRRLLPELPPPCQRIRQHPSRCKGGRRTRLLTAQVQVQHEAPEPLTCKGASQMLRPLLAYVPIHHGADNNIGCYRT